jgi:hypothetical protein
MSAATLTAEQTAALAALADGPAARAAVAAREAERAEQRQAVLARLADDLAAAREAAEAAGAAVAPLAAAAEKARAAHEVALAKLHAAEAERSRTGAAVEAVEGRAVHELRPLGGSAIDDTLRAVLHGERTALGGLTFRAARGAFGGGESVTGPDASAVAWVSRLRAMRAELEAMRLADVTPQAIEARCATIAAEVETGPSVPTTAAARASGLDVFTRLWRRA